MVGVYLVLLLYGGHAPCSTTVRWLCALFYYCKVAVCVCLDVFFCKFMVVRINYIFYDFSIISSLCLLFYYCIFFLFIFSFYMYKLFTLMINALIVDFFITKYLHC